MDNPNLYLKSNSLQAEDTITFLDEFFKLVKWGNKEEYVMDIGCAVGNNTCDNLMPLLSENVKKIVGVDINENMISKAKQIYKNPKVEFDVLDIGGEIPENMAGKFDHVFSFFCLHWIQDQKKVMRNIYSLLKPGGDTLFLMPQKCEQIHVNYLKMSSEPRWKEYMNDVMDFMLPYQDVAAPIELLTTNLEEARFKVEMCQIQHKKYSYNEKTLTEFSESINPFVKRMPEEVKKEFMKDFVRRFRELDPEGHQDVEKITKHYTLLLAYAVKPQI